MGFPVSGFGFEIKGVGFRILRSGFRVYGSGFEFTDVLGELCVERDSNVGIGG